MKRQIITFMSALVICISCDGADEQPTLDSRAVSLETLDQAARETTDCLRDAGLAEATAEYDPRAFTFVFTVRGSGEAIDRVVDDCIDGSYEPINERWQAANAPAIEAANRDLEQAVLGCLEHRGDAARSGGAAREDSKRAAPAAREACLLEVLRARESPTG